MRSLFRVYVHGRGGGRDSLTCVARGDSRSLTVGDAASLFASLARVDASLVELREMGRSPASPALPRALLLATLFASGADLSASTVAPPSAPSPAPTLSRDLTAARDLLARRQVLAARPLLERLVRAGGPADKKAAARSRPAARARLEALVELGRTLLLRAEEAAHSEEARDAAADGALVLLGEAASHALLKATAADKGQRYAVFLLLGRAHKAAGDAREAAEAFLQARRVAEGARGRGGVPARGATEAAVWAARALYADKATRSEGVRLMEEAVGADQDCVAALSWYAAVARDCGQPLQAIPYALRAAVQAEQAEEAARQEAASGGGGGGGGSASALHPGRAPLVESTAHARLVFAELVAHPGGLAELRANLPGAASMPSSLIVLARVLKNAGAVSEAAALYEQAATGLRASPDRAPGVLLSLVHTEEVLYRYADAYSRARDLFAALTAADPRSRWAEVAAVVCAVRDVDDPRLAHGDHPDVPAYDLAAVPASVLEHRLGPDGACTLDAVTLDTLALAFSAAKILYVRGAVQPLPALVAALEKFRAGQDLAATAVRNEHAYYLCMCGVLAGPRPPPCAPAARDGRPLYLLGDSHCISPAWQRLGGGDGGHVVPRLATGLKCWHLRDGCRFFPRANFESAVDAVPEGSRAVFAFGEIDCREGMLRAVEQARYDSLDEAVAASVAVYVAAVARAARRRRLSAVYVHPVPPVLDATRPVVTRFNLCLQAAVKSAPGMRWLDFWPRLLGDDGALRDEYTLDGTHLSPAYLDLLEAAL